MRSEARVAIALLLASACTDECPDDVCTNPGEMEHFAGPCRSAARGFICDFGYDDEQRMAKVACTYQDQRDPEWRVDYTTTWTYEGTDLREVRWTQLDHLEGLGDNGAIWYFADDEITAAYGAHNTAPVAAFDPALFAFDPAVGSQLAYPRAELGLLERGDEMFTWTREGNRLTRQSLSPRPGAPATATFDLDSRDRLITKTIGSIVDGYRYEGDLLVEHQHWVDGSTQWVRTYQHDLGGNLLTIGDERYDYRCWR